MTITHSTETRNALADQITTQVDAGVSNASIVIIESAGPTDLASIPMQDPSFGAASSGTITAQGLPLAGTASANGTADTFEVRQSNSNVVFSGSAGTSGTDLTLDSVNITSGQTVTINNCQYSAPN